MSHLPWSRFWHPRGTEPIYDPTGFTLDPLAWGTSSHVVPFEKLADVPCIVLLGEAGLGKSTTIKAIADARPAAGVVRRLWNLGRYGTEDRLCRDLLQGSQTRAWIEGANTLELFLDGYDECVDRIPHLPEILDGFLEDSPTERLRLRIVSRPAATPNLEKILARWWSAKFVPGAPPPDDPENSQDGTFQAWELLPLRREDVELAARERGLESEEFLRAVIDRGLQSLAFKPVTLNLLLEMFERSKSLPARLWDLYEDGLQALSEKAGGAEHRLRVTVQAVSPSEVLLVASRIAAYMTFCSKTAFGFGLGTAGVRARDEVLEFEAIDSGEESDGRHAIRVDRDSVQLVLRHSGLFSARGSDVYAFGHATYQEFLTARYLVTRGIAGRDLRKLIHAAPDHELLVPGFRTLGGWLAGAIPELREWILEREGDTLLQGDVGALPDEARASILERFLERCEREELGGEAFDWVRHVVKLAHPGRTDQLRRRIEDRSLSPLVRRIAVFAVDLCGISSLAPTLAAVALDPSEDIILRSRCAAGVAGIGSPEAKRLLLPLAMGEAGDDPQGDLRGYGLAACWPGVLDTRQMLRQIEEMPRRGGFGGFSKFLRDSTYVDAIPVPDLPIALEWARSLAGREHGEHLVRDDLNRFLGGIVRRAWEQIHDPVVCLELARLIAELAEGYRDVPYVSPGPERWGARGTEKTFSEVALAEDRESERWRLLVMLVERTEVPSSRLTYNPNLVKGSDFFQVLKRARSQGPFARRWCGILPGFERFPDFWKDAAIQSVLLESREELASINIDVNFSTKTDLASEEAAVRRKNHNDQAAFEAREAQPARFLHPGLPVRYGIQQCLEVNYLNWALVVNALMRDPVTMRISPYPPLDLRDTPGWNLLEPGERGQVVTCAHHFVANHQPPRWDLIRPDERYPDDQYGITALAILAAHGRLSVVPAPTWRGWATSLLRCFDLSDPNGLGDAADLGRMLVREALEHAREVLLAQFARQIEYWNSAHDTLSLGMSADCIVDASMSKIVIERIEAGCFEWESCRVLLETMLDRDLPEAMQCCITLVSRRSDEAPEIRRLSLLAAALVFFREPTLGWSLIRDTREQDPEWFHAALRHACPGIHPYREVSLVALSEEDELSLYESLLSLYPYEGDRIPTDGPRAMSEEDRMRSWRGAVISHLSARGTTAAVAAIESIVETHPERPWMRSLLSKARDALHESAWTPWTPAALRQYFEEARTPTMLRVLFIGSEPDGEDRLHLDREVRDIESKVRSSEHRDRIRFETAWAVRPDALQDRMNEVRPHILHFSGHGDEEGLLLQNAADSALYIPGEALRMALKANPGLRLIVLNTCQSAGFASLLLGVIDAVIGMDAKIGDASAICFAKQLYSSIGFGLSLQQAFDQAVALMAMEGTGQHDVPKLYVASGVDASTLRLIDV